MTRQLLKLETDEKKRQKLIELRRHIEETMREDDAQKEQDIEETRRQAAKSKERAETIDKLEEFGEFLTESEDEPDKSPRS